MSSILEQNLAVCPVAQWQVEFMSCHLVIQNPLHYVLTTNSGSLV